MAARMDEAAAPRWRRHVLHDLGFAIARHDGTLRGSAALVPEMHVPGTTNLRISILAAWADVLAGHLAVDVVAPRVPVTLELDMHLWAPAPAVGSVDGVGRVLKAGRTVFAAAVDFTTDDGERVGFSASSFMAAPDERLRVTGLLDGDRPAPVGRLTRPFADRVNCTLGAPGVAVLPHSDDVLNASNTINGGLIALVAEEAVLSLSPAGTSLSSLALRYLQPARVGPVVATAQVHGSLGWVELRDAGNEDRLCAVATTRTFEGTR